MQASAPALADVADADAESENWWVRVTSMMVPSESAIREITVRLIAVAETNAGVYDASEAALVR
jgi:hypothetical protein